MNLWVVSMECAGIIEAGGVKNVTFSLCKEFSKIGHKVTLFIPIFKTNSWDLIKDLNKNFINNIEIFHCGKNEKIDYFSAVCCDGNFKIVFINHLAFINKEAVYTYTFNEEKLNPEHKKGCGHTDTLFMDSIFAKAVAEFVDFIPEKEYPDIIHCQDASTAMVPVFISKKKINKKIKSVVTIHNAGPAYHHSFSSIGEAAWYTGLTEEDLSGALNNYKVEPFILALNSGANLTTVSEDYAEELSNPDFENETEGLSKIFFNRGISIKGITNGIDYDRYDPTDTSISCLPFAFSPSTGNLQGKINNRLQLLNEIQFEKNIDDIKTYGLIKSNNPETDVFICYHGRITTQKGISILLNSIPAILNNFKNAFFIIAGQGESSIEKSIIELTEKFSTRILFFNGYNKKIARLVNSTGDFIVLPSYFEPCGLEDFISQVYGTLPVAHSTGGLKKIVDYKTGFLYDENTPECLIAKLSEVITIKNYSYKTILKMIKYTSVYIQKNYLWKDVITKQYLKYFKEILKNQ